MQFTLLTTLDNQHPPIIVGNRNKPLYCKVPDSLPESLAHARLGVKQNAKICAMVKQNVMKLEVFILGGQIIDQKRWWRGRRERIEKGSRERIEIERKEI